MENVKILPILAFLCLLNTYLTAQEMTSVEAEPLPILTSTEEPEEEKEESSFSISGFVDAYYQYSFNEQAFPTSFTESHNSFSLGMANVVLSKEGKVGFVADLAVGPRAEVANGYNGSTLAAIKQLSDE